MKLTELMTKLVFNMGPSVELFRRVARTIELIAMESEAIRLRCGLHALLEEWYSTPEGERPDCDHVPPRELARLLEGTGRMNNRKR